MKTINLKDSVRDLCTIKYLKDAIKECEEYNGWSKQDMLEHYMNNCGFGPTIVLPKFREDLIDKYCPKHIKEGLIFQSNLTELDLDSLYKLQIMIYEYTTDRTHRAIIFELIKTKGN